MINMETVTNASTSAAEKVKFIQSERIMATDMEITNNNNNEIDLHDDNGNNNKEEDLNLGDTSNYSTEERNVLFQRGLEYETSFKPNAALQCYLGCIQGLKNRNMFVHLPQCLHKIADIHSSQENYDCAVQFAQAEKLCYEAGICEAEEIQQKIDEIAGSIGVGPTDLSELNIEDLRAEEYEQLAKLCLLKKQHQLALEYAGQCTKLRQQIYGNNHEKTKLSHSLFATEYAQLRRQQYAGTLLDTELRNDNDLNGNNSRAPEVIMSQPEGGAPVSILRQRSEGGSKETDREKKQVRFHESVDENMRLKERGELASISMTFIQLAVCAMILASMGMWLYCSLEKSQSCQSLISQCQHWVRTVQYYYRTFFTYRRPS